MNLLQRYKNLLLNKTQDKTKQDMKLTDWYNGNIKPVHIGVYERKSNHGLNAYSYWDGNHWKMFGATPLNAEESQCGDNSVFQTLPWRGIADAHSPS